MPMTRTTLRTVTDLQQINVDVLHAQTDGSDLVDDFVKKMIPSVFSQGIVKYDEQSNDIKLDLSDATEYTDNNITNHMTDFYDMIASNNQKIISYIGAAIDDYCLNVDSYNKILIDKWDTKLFDTVDFDRISKKHTGDIIDVDVEIMDCGKPKTTKLDTEWECQMGHYTRKDNPRWVDKIKPPAQCKKDGCACKPTSRVKNSSYVTVDTRRMILKKIDSDDRNSRTLTGDVTYPYLNSVERRDKYNALAKVHMADRDNNSQSEPYLEIIALDKIDNTVDLDDDKRAMFDSIKDEYDSIDNYVDDVAASVAPEIIDKDGQHTAKLGALLGAVRCSGYTGRNTIHTLLYGLPGTAKSEIIEYLDDRLPDSKLADLQNASTAGLTATATKTARLSQDGQNWIVTSGTIPQADGSVAFLDELDKNDIDETVLGKPMQSEQVIVSKAGAGDIKASTSIVATANPTDMMYKDPNNKITSLDISSHIQDRFDLILNVEDKVESKEEETDMIDQMLVDPDDDPDDTNDDEVLYNKHEMSNYIQYTREFDPSWTKEANELLKEYLVNMRMTFDNVQNPDLRVSNRAPNKVQRLSCAVARLCLSDEITEDHVEIAWDLFKSGWQSVTDINLDN